MTNATTLTVKGGGTAAQAIRHADDGIAKWLKDLITGEGSSPAHIIVTGILGVVPGVGQAFDARDIILGTIQIVKTPAHVGLWIELVITLIGCVPAVGDALKVGFKLMKQGHNFGRVLEGVSPALRGNVERFMRNIDWSALTNQTKQIFDKALHPFIDGFDSWIVKSVAGRHQVRTIVEELKALQKQGPKMIDDAFAELKQLHGKLMAHELPGSTAAVNSASAKAAKEETQQAASAGTHPASSGGKAISEKTRNDVTKNHALPERTKADTKKKAQAKKQNWGSGIPAEHITDYYIRKKHTNFRKANNNGRLVEEIDLPHHGLDHLWANKTHAVKPFVVGETKSSIFDSFRLISALPPDLKDKFDVLKAEEAANPTSTNGKPNIFHSEGRDAQANQRVKIGDSPQHEQAIKQGVNKPNEDTGLPTQMSHAWIARTVKTEKLTVHGHELKRLLVKYHKSAGLDPDLKLPYQRWISLVTGRQLHKHQKLNVHEIQLMLDLPDNILDK